MRPKPYNQAEVDAWLRHGKDFAAAADEIGVAKATLRARLINWRVYTPKRAAHCRQCGRPIRPKGNQTRCRGCIAKLKTKGRRGPRPLKIGHPKPVPPRSWDCRHYDRCLDAAARKSDGGRLSCKNCPRYRPEDPRRLIGQVGETCAAKVI